MNRVNYIKNVLPYLFVCLIMLTYPIFIHGQNSRNHNGKGKNLYRPSSSIRFEDGTITIVLNHERMINSGIKITQLHRTSHQNGITAYGSVVSIQDLANDIKNFEAERAQLEKAKESFLISKKNYGRVKSLYENKLESEQDYESSQAAFLSDEADVSSAESNLISIKSSIIEQWGNRIADWIFNDSSSEPYKRQNIELQKLLSLKTALVQISLPPDEAAISKPDEIYILSPKKKDQMLKCRFVSAGHLVNPQFQTRALFYITSANYLSGGMNVNVLIPTRKILKGVIIPSSSIVWYQGKAWIYAEKNNDEFSRVEISTSNPASDGFFIPQGKGLLAPGTYIVTSGAQLLLSKELLPVQGNSAGEGDDD